MVRAPQLQIHEILEASRGRRARIMELQFAALAAARNRRAEPETERARLRETEPHGRLHVLEILLIILTRQQPISTHTPT